MRASIHGARDKSGGSTARWLWQKEGANGTGPTKQLIDHAPKTAKMMIHVPCGDDKGSLESRLSAKPKRGDAGEKAPLRPKSKLLDA